MDKKESLVSKIIWGMMDELEVDNDILTNGYIELKVKEIEQEIDRAREERTEKILEELFNLIDGEEGRYLEVTTAKTIQDMIINKLTI